MRDVGLGERLLPTLIHVLLALQVGVASQTDRSDVDLWVMSQLPGDGVDSWESSSAVEAAQFQAELEESRRENARLQAKLAAYEVKPARALRLLQAGSATATREEHADGHAAAQDQHALADVPAEAYSMGYYLDNDCSSRSSSRHYVIKPAAFQGCFNIERKGSVTSSFQLTCGGSGREVTRRVHHNRDCSGSVSRMQRMDWGVFEGGCHRGKRLVPPLRAEDYPACKLGGRPARKAPLPGQSMLEADHAVFDALPPRDGFLPRARE